MTTTTPNACKFIDTYKDNPKELVIIAKIAEQAERYDDMAVAMRWFAELQGKLSNEERNLLSVAYKNVVGARRSAWRILFTIVQKADCPKRKEIASSFLAKVESELNCITSEMLGLLEKHLITSECTDEEKVFYQKMKGDYHRYIAEYKCEQGPERTAAITSADECYSNAMVHAKNTMAPTHPSRLGLALNFSVFYFEILNCPDKACSLAKEAFDDAISELEKLNENDCKDSTLIMQLLRDNLTLWTSDSHTENGDDQ